MQFNFLTEALPVATETPQFASLSAPDAAKKTPLADSSGSAPGGFAMVLTEPVDLIAGVSELTNADISTAEAHPKGAMLTLPIPPAEPEISTLRFAGALKSEAGPEAVATSGAAPSNFEAAKTEIVPASGIPKQPRANTEDLLRPDTLRKSVTRELETPRRQPQVPPSTTVMKDSLSKIPELPSTRIAARPGLSEQVATRSEPRQTTAPEARVSTAASYGMTIDKAARSIGPVSADQPEKRSAAPPNLSPMKEFAMRRTDESGAATTALKRDPSIPIVSREPGLQPPRTQRPPPTEVLPQKSTASFEEGREFAKTSLRPEGQQSVALPQTSRPASSTPTQQYSSVGGTDVPPKAETGRGSPSIEQALATTQSKRSLDTTVPMPSQNTEPAKLQQDLMVARPPSDGPAVSQPARMPHVPKAMSDEVQIEPKRGQEPKPTHHSDYDAAIPRSARAEHLTTGSTPSSPALVKITPPASSPAIFAKGNEVVETHINTSLAAAEAPELERTTSPDLPRSLSPSSQPARADLVRSVMQQMSAAVAQSGDGTIDVRLSPEDLGRVRLALTPGDLGMTITITAERSDTMDLVRRHIDIFAQDLRQNGFQNLSFAFGQNQAHGDERETSSAEPVEIAIEDEAPTPSGHTTSEVETGRLDLRL